MRVAYFNELGAYAVAHYKSPCFGYAKYCLPKMLATAGQLPRHVAEPNLRCR